MALDQLVLGLLAQGPAHGYRLRARLEEAFGARRPVEASHVYAALAGLERQRLVASRVAHDQQGRTRRVFAITAAGRRQLRAWCDLPTACPTLLRRPLLLKTAIAALLGERLARRSLQAERASRERLLRDLAAVPLPGPIARLLQDRARRHVEVELWLLDVLAGRATPTTRPPGSGSR